jgi:hypothetical protein
MSQWKYVGADPVDIPALGLVGVVRGAVFDTDLDLSGREDFEPVTPKRNTKKES